MTAVDMSVFFSVFFGGAFILSQIQKLSNSLIVRMIGYKGMIFVSFPGVVVHELGHLALCWIFLHRVNRVRFFEVNQASGSLGYVSHSYNLRSTYQQAGNFFIGMAPLIGGSLAIYFLVNHFFSSELTNPFDPSGNYNLATTLFDNIPTHLTFFTDTTSSIMSGLWTYVIKEPWYGLLLTFIMISIALHASPSRSDLHGALSGGIAIAILVFLLNTIALYFFSCCEEGNLSYWLANLKAWIVYAGLVMMNLICFTLALATIGLALVSSAWIFLSMFRR